MLLSMTGYGRATISSRRGEYLIEVQSVNRKYLEINAFLARELFPFEVELRKLLASRLSRGQVTLRITHTRLTSKIKNSIPAPELLSTLVKSYETLLQEVGISERPPITYILNKIDELGSELPNLDEAFKKELILGLENAVESLQAMKQEEGAQLKKDMLQQLDRAESILLTIESLSNEAFESNCQKLFEKYEAFVGEVQDPDRLIKEAFILAERSDINEEIARLKSHFHQFKNFLDDSSDGIGKNLDFLVQEMHREVGTTLAKAFSIEIKKYALEMKGLIEKIREQVQNIE